MNRHLVSAGAAVFLLAVPIPALAQPLSATPNAGLVEAATAFHYTEMAYVEDDIDLARMDLQEAINCLVGSEDKSFSAVAGNPCSGQGKGAIHDIKDAALRRPLQSALGEASYALTKSELNSIQMYALSAMDYMRTARNDWGFLTANDMLTSSRGPRHTVVKLRVGEIMASQLKDAALRNSQGSNIGTITDMVLDTEAQAVRLVGLEPYGHDSDALAIRWSALNPLAPIKPNSGYATSLSAEALAAAPDFTSKVRAQPSYIDVERNLLGRPVVMADGENIGKVVDLVIERKSGKIDYALVSGNSVLGLAESPLALRWTTIADAVTEHDIILTLDERQLVDVPVFIFR